MTFDPTTAYLGEHQWHNFIEEATLEIPNGTTTPDQITGLHVRREDISTSAYQGIATGLALSSSAAAFVIWAPVDPNSAEAVELGIRQGSVLRLDESLDGWVIHAHERSRFGHYVAVCDKEAVNAAT